MYVIMGRKREIQYYMQYRKWNFYNNRLFVTRRIMNILKNNIENVVFLLIAVLFFGNAEGCY